MENGRPRIHIKKDLGDQGMQVNIFGETAAETIALFNEVIATLKGEKPVPNTAAAVPNTATPATVKPATAVPTATPATVKPATPAKKATAVKATAVNAPVCQECGMNESMELIRWEDRNTGEARKAWKCQNCKAWFYSPSKKVESLPY